MLVKHRDLDKCPSPSEVDKAVMKGKEINKKY